MDMLADVMVGFSRGIVRINVNDCICEIFQVMQELMTDLLSNLMSLFD